MDWSALASAFLGGSLGTPITGWFDRRARRSERDADFQRETLKELLDTLEAFIWDIQAIEQWRREPDHWKTITEQQREQLPESERARYKAPPFDYLEHEDRLIGSANFERFTKRRLRMEKLANQVNDEHVRTQCFRLSFVANQVVNKPAYERASVMIGAISERIGALLRGESGILIELGTTSGEPARYVSQRRLL